MFITIILSKENCVVLKIVSLRLPDEYKTSYASWKNANYIGDIIIIFANWAVVLRDLKYLLCAMGIIIWETQWI